MNLATICGNLGADPELRYTQSGTAVMNLSIATTEPKKVGNDWEDHVEWHRITVWDKRAEGLAKVLCKGSKVLVTGPLRTTSWEDKQGGGKRWKTEILARNVELCGGKKKEQQQQQGPPQGQQQQQPQGQGWDQDDIPFR